MRGSLFDVFSDETGVIDFSEITEKLEALEIQPN